MEQQPKISIIVPVYNVEQYLRECLDSLVNQTLAEIEIICVNDASPDNSMLILEEYQKRDCRVKIIDLKENLKQGGARNRAIEVAQGKYIAFVDSDDFISLDMYQLLYDASENGYIDMVSCNYYNYYSEDSIQKVTNFDIDIKCNWYREMIITGGLWPAAIYRRSLFLDNHLRFPEHLFYEDNALAPLLFCFVVTHKRVDSPLYYYRLNNASTTRSSNNYRYFDRLITANIFLDNMKKYGFYDRYKDEIEYRFILLYFYSTIIGCLTRFTPPERVYINRVKSEIKLLMPLYSTNIYYGKRPNGLIRLLTDITILNTSLGIIAYKLYLHCSKIKRKIVKR